MPSAVARAASIAARAGVERLAELLWIAAAGLGKRVAPASATADDRCGAP